MTATTYTNIRSTKPGASFGGKIRRFFRSLIEAREEAVRKQIASQFRGLDDEYLVSLGYSPADIARIRRI